MSGILFAFLEAKLNIWLQVLKDTDEVYHEHAELDYASVSPRWGAHGHLRRYCFLFPQSVALLSFLVGLYC